MFDSEYNQLDIMWKQYIMQVSDTTVENMVNQLYNDEVKIKQLEAEIERLKSEIEHLKAKSVAKPS
jgi:peptidoglycan hydrolase CwlO-like protein